MRDTMVLTPKIKI